ncbi:MAG: PEGA domain-containing protein, partial [Myxococcota bacterium]|nr:PEGA domain-containing protein [Myxococcota bacterium]
AEPPPAAAIGIDATDEDAESEDADDDDDDVAPATPAPPMGVTAQGPVSAKEGYADPLYASIPPGERGKRRSKAIWVFGALIALLLVVVAGGAIHGQLKERGPGETDSGAVVHVDRSAEVRAPDPGHRQPPATNGDADATPEDVQSEEVEPTPGEPEIEEETPAVEPPIPVELSLEERRREEEAREQRRREREERRKEREERERREREEREREDAAAAAGTDDDGGDPWSTGIPGTTVAPPADPTNPWATGTPGNASGQLTISSTPVGASFTIDGQSSGSTPLTVTVDYGVHVLRVEKVGYVAQERRVDVNAGRLFQDFSLQPLAAKSKLTVFTHPEAGATLFVDGAQRGATPVTIEISPGIHTLRVVLDGFPVREETIDLSDLQPGEVRRRTIDMQ